MSSENLLLSLADMKPKICHFEMFQCLVGVVIADAALEHMDGALAHMDAVLKHMDATSAHMVGSHRSATTFCGS